MTIPYQHLASSMYLLSCRQETRALGQVPRLNGVACLFQRRSHIFSLVTTYIHSTFLWIPLIAWAYQEEAFKLQFAPIPSCVLSHLAYMQRLQCLDPLWQIMVLHARHFHSGRAFENLMS